jgi:hypothetical protein
VRRRGPLGSVPRKQMARTGFTHGDGPGVSAELGRPRRKRLTTIFQLNKSAGENKIGKILGDLRKCEILYGDRF